MLFDQTYKTISVTCSGFYSEKGSKFEAFVFPVKSEAEAKDMLQKTRSLHPKANHHCWALRLTTDRTVFRLSDDGEPSGTAGKPLLNTLLSNDLTDILVVVVRYFGGIQLGIPGLIKAYKTAAANAILNGNIVEKDLEDLYELRTDYSQMHEIIKIIKEENLRVVEQHLDNQTTFIVSIPKRLQHVALSKLENKKMIEVKFLESK